MPAILIIIFIVIVAIGRLAKYHNEQLEKEIGPVEFHPFAKLKEAREQRLKKKNELHIYIHDVKEDEKSERHQLTIKCGAMQEGTERPVMTIFPA